MKISWYPGHMHKAKKELIKTLGSTAVVIEVLDARVPNASSNPLLAELAAGLPVIKVLNKCDLGDSKTNSAWINHFKKFPNTVCLSTELDKQQVLTSILAALKTLSPSDESAQLMKQQCLIAGIPNVGKSTLVNAMAGRKAAKTGNEPAVTQGQQRIKLDQHWTLIDSPGMLWPNLQDQRTALCLALTGAIRQTALDIEDIGWQSAELLFQLTPHTLMSRYKINQPPKTTKALMEAIAGHIGAIGKKGSLNWHKTAEALLNDFRSGKLGRLSLESPPE